MSGIVGNLFGSKGTPSSQQQSSGITALPQWAQDAFQSAVNQGQSLTSNSSNFAPVAMNSYQTGAGDLINKGYTNIDSNSLSSMLSNFTNPYEDQVVNKAITDLKRTGSGLLNDIGSGATSAGGFGGTRQAALESDLIKNTQQQAADTSASIRSSNYNNAVTNAINSINSNNSTQSQQISDLSNYGAGLQNQQQAEKDAPQQALTYLMSILNGIPSTSQGTSTGATNDSGFLGRLSQVAGNFGNAARGFSGGA